MKKIKMIFPSGEYAVATLLFDDEPELAQDLWDRLETPQKGLCRVTLSTGDSYGILFRPLSEVPKAAGTLRAPIGNKRLFYTELTEGNLLWSRSRLYVCYGPCTEPGLVGSKVAQIDPEYMKLFKRECEEVRNHTFYYHEQALVGLERAGEGD